MSNLLTSSIGKKLIMSLSGLFLITFLLVHLTVNLMLVFDDSGILFNKAAHFMGSNPVIELMEPVLALGFIIHIIYASYLTLQNQMARPKGYARSEQGSNASWASRNMYILGGLVLVFLVLHLYNFFWKIKYAGDPLLAPVVIDGVETENAYALVSTLFRESVLFDVLYIAGAILLGLHLTHGFWSAFQTIGWNNDIWRNRLKAVAYFFAFVFGIGFSIIPLYFLFFV